MNGKEQWLVLMIKGDGTPMVKHFANTKDEAIAYVKNSIIGTYYIVQSLMMAAWM